MKLLVDGDIVAYQAAASCETPVNWGDGLWTLHAFEQDVDAYITDMMFGLINSNNFTEVVTPLSHTHNYRKDLADDYKANRKETRKPMLLQYAKDFIFKNFNGVIWKNLEADDVLGIMGSEEFESVIWSKDKDLKTIPANHLIDNRIVAIDEDEANYWFFYQTLVGDRTDNYPGCPGIGPKKAEAILSKDCSWESVVAAYEKAKLSEEVALDQARLARILRTGEYDLETGAVKLWTP